MTEIKLNIESVRMNMKVTRQQMADLMGINLDRYNRLAVGETKMLATEFVSLHEISGIPWDYLDPGCRTD